jgi:Big-like domain-containing protein
MLTSVRRACLAVAFAVLAVLGGVVVTALPDCTEHCQTLAAAPQGVVVPQPSPTEPARLTITPKPSAEDIDPLARILVTAETGTLTTVTMVNDGGKEIPGILTPDAKTWKPTTTLGFGRTYTMTIAAKGPGGMPTRQVTTFTTLTPNS